jgi:hypothetical protein
MSFSTVLGSLVEKRIFALEDGFFKKKGRKEGREF